LITLASTLSLSKGKAL